MAKSLEIQLTKILDKYANDLDEISESSIREVAEETVNELKQTSPVDPHSNRSGQYARSWHYRKETTLRGVTDFVVYNDEAGLTHLLEHGHSVRPSPKHDGKKSRVEGQPHIKPAREHARIKLVKLIKGKL